MPIPRGDLTGLRAAHQRLLHDLDDLTDAEVAAPALLPGWSAGHVITHLARNADGFTRMVMAAVAGERGHQYPGGPEQRAHDIEAGAARPVADQLEDLRRSTDDLDAAWGRLTRDAWAEGIGISLSGERRVADMPFRRWREVEMHHVDLGRPSFTFHDWSEGYVERELGVTLDEVPGRLGPGIALRIRFDDSTETVASGGHEPVMVSGTRRWVLAWLTGRVQAPDLPVLGPWP